MPRHLRPSYLFPKTVISLAILHVLVSLHYPSPKFLSVNLLLLFIVVFSFLAVVFPSGFLSIGVVFSRLLVRWLRSKRYLIYSFCNLCFLNMWWLYRFHGGNPDSLPVAPDDVVTILMTCIAQCSSSDSLVESNILPPYAEYISIKDIQPSILRRYELKRDCSHLTSDLQRPEKRRRRLVAVVVGKSVRGFPIIQSDTTQPEDWSGLHIDSLTEIIMKLHAFHDLAVLSTVCRRWRNVCLNLKWSLYPPHPWSIHFQDQNILNHLDDGRYVLERLKIHGRYYYGCVNGWILNIGSKYIHIFNIFSRTQTNLPMLSPVGYLPITKPSDWYNYIQKFILFNQGDNLQFLVVALLGPRDFISFTGPQFQDWIWIQSDNMALFKDVVLFGERFYALCGRGKLVLCAFDTSNPSVSLVSHEPAGSFRADRYYLVKNADHLIGVFQNGNIDSRGKRFDTVTFRIYKYEDTMNWTHIGKPDYLRGRALFISNGNSWMIDPVEVKNCRANSIYFADEYWFRNNGDGHFTGLFDIAEGKIEEIQFEKDKYPPNDSSPFLLTYNGKA